MKLSEYQQQALRTATAQPDFVPPAKPHYHWALGFIGELGEIKFASQHDLADELGDVFWYIAMFCHDFGLDFEEVMSLKKSQVVSPDAEDWHTATLLHVCFLAEALKKHDWYQKRPKDLLFNLIKRELSLIAFLLRMHIDRQGLSLESILVGNISKLKERYPDRFDA
jgi:hypothetical protein